MHEYKEAVKELANNREDYNFPNKGKDHAKIVLGMIFETTNDEISMFSGELDYEILKDIFESISSFIDRGGKLRIILDKPDIPYNDIISFLCKKNIPIKIANDVFRKNVKALSKNAELYHFIIGDRRAFRIEVDTNEYKAICNFNNPDVSQRFLKIFNDYFDDLEDFEGCR